MGQGTYLGFTVLFGGCYITAHSTFSTALEDGLRLGPRRISRRSERGVDASVACTVKRFSWEFQ